MKHEILTTLENRILTYDHVSSILNITLKLNNFLQFSMGKNVFQSKLKGTFYFIAEEQRYSHCLSDNYSSDFSACVTESLAVKIQNRFHFTFLPWLSFGLCIFVFTVNTGQFICLFIAYLACLSVSELLFLQASFSFFIVSQAQCPQFQTPSFSSQQVS